MAAATGLRMCGCQCEATSAINQWMQCLPLSQPVAVCIAALNGCMAAPLAAARGRQTHSRHTSTRHRDAPVIALCRGAARGGRAGGVPGLNHEEFVYV